MAMGLAICLPGIVEITMVLGVSKDMIVFNFQKSLVGNGSVGVQHEDVEA